MKRLVISFVVLVLTVVVALPIFAADEAFYITGVDTVGCQSGDLGFFAMRANFVGNDQYGVRTMVTVGDKVYMNEQAYLAMNGSENWNIYSTFTYSPVPNPGMFPLPTGEEVRIDFLLERPHGNVLYSWTTILDSCDTGNILYNGETASVPTGCRLNIDGSVVGEAPNGAQIYYAPGHATNLSLNPGTYIVIGQDESETYYQVVLGCQTHWVRKDTMQQSYQAPQNGAPLPTRIVG